MVTPVEEATKTTDMNLSVPLTSPEAQDPHINPNIKLDYGTMAEVHDHSDTNSDSHDHKDSDDEFNPYGGKSSHSHGAHHGHNHGNELPNEGYCLLFMRKTAHHELIIDNDKLVLHIRSDITDEAKEKADKIHISRPGNFLAHFKRAKILYTVQYSKDEFQTYVVVVIAISHEDAEDWADKKNLDVRIESREAIKIGRKANDFLLANRTHLDDGIDHAKYKDDISGQEFDKLPLSTWKYIHINYEGSIDHKVYKRYPPNNNLLDNRLYLRILYEILTEDKSIGGANFVVNRYKRNKYHPFVTIFAINLIDDDGPTQRPVLTKEEIKWFQKESLWDKKVDEIRDYYGELIAFYFAFLRLYTMWLIPISILGTIWFIIQLILGKIAIPGTFFLVLLALIWATAMIEHWYRYETWLRYKWGMMNFKSTEVPRASFKGQLIISPSTGDIVEVYRSYIWYYSKILCSTSTMVLCIACVVAAVFGIWTLKSLWGDDTTISIGIGILNSVQIQIFNKLYTYLALFLNEKEGHRLEADYYNHLVIKKILFYVVNSFNSLFYIAFYNSDSYDSNEDCLESVRTQLVTLFLTAIFWQNSVEILFPKIWALACGQVIERQQEKYQQQADDAQKQMLASTETEAVKTKTESEENQYAIKSEAIVFNELSVSDEMWEDIADQIKRTDSPDVLANTSEMVIQYGYIMLFVLVFPIMPLLGWINNYLETRVDIYNLLEARRPVPFAANGIGVWKAVISIGGTVAVFTNMSLITFRTDIVSEFLGNDDQTSLLTFFFVSCLILILMKFVVRFSIPDMTEDTKCAIIRQEQCERHLLLNSVKKMAKTVSTEKKPKVINQNIAAGTEIESTHNE